MGPPKFLIFFFCSWKYFASYSQVFESLFLEFVFPNFRHETKNEVNLT